MRKSEDLKIPYSKNHYLRTNITQLQQHYQKSDIEIIIATMNRNNFDFLKAMFVNCNFDELNILIINQTAENQLLVSDFLNVKVINSFEKGLSKSRNLGLRNAEKDILILTDDDVVYIHDFLDKILFSYNNYSSSVHCFRTETFQGNFYSKYPNDIVKLKKKGLVKILSIEITFLRKTILKNDCYYNELFGLGAQFEDAETLFFLRNCYHKSLNIMFFPFTIVKHESISSSDDVTSNRLIYAKMAGFYKRYQYIAYLFLYKYIFFLIRKKLVPFNKIQDKLKVGLVGIADYKLLLKNKLDSKNE